MSMSCDLNNSFLLDLTLVMLLKALTLAKKTLAWEILDAD